MRSFSFNLPVGGNKEYGLNRANLGSVISLSQSSVTYISRNIVFESPEPRHVARSLFTAQRAVRGPIMVELTVLLSCS
ncbi:unnamed protein product, partial [Mesorhabditis belari]|uniref:Uncharacterized protein n=1 Tax=Mesorhabditis belari TaxID=2138241 RepID=A0AAF3F6H7_9BILA